MKTSLAILLTVLLLLPVSAFGEVQIITHRVKQTFGGSQSAHDARIFAIAKAKREALEMAGVHVEAQTIGQDSKMDKDQILALAGGVLKAEMVSQENYHTKDAFGIGVVVRVAVDMSTLEERVKTLLQDRTHLEKLNQARKKEKELLNEVAKLSEENQRLMAKMQGTGELKMQFHDTSQSLSALEWYGNAISSWTGNKHTDPQKAIEYLNEAIRLKPAYAAAYLQRGIAYRDLGQHQRAIEDFNETIRLKPADLAEAYVNRGDVYVNLGQHQRAIEDFNEAIRLKPTDAFAYDSRGIAYGNMERYDEAIQSFRQAVRINPGYVNAWYSLGIAYSDLKRYSDAIDSYLQAVRINPEFTKAWYNLGIAYDDIKRYNDAIKAYRQAIQIDPEYANAWYNLAISCFHSGNRAATQEAVQELRRLDPKQAAELFKLTAPR